MLAHQRLLGLVVAALQAAPALAPAEVLRQRTRPLPEGVDRGVSVRLVNSRPRATVMSVIDWQTVIAVEFIARCGASMSPDEAVGPLVTAGHQSIVGAAALSAAGFSVEPEPHLDWDQNEFDERVGACTAFYTFRHRTGWQDLNT